MPTWRGNPTRERVRVITALSNHGGARMQTRMWMMSSTTVTRLFFMLALSSAASAQEWRFYGGDAGGRRSSPLKQINRQNVGSLKRAWTYQIREADPMG